ncbi:MOS1T transposase, partial [Pseudoatta argentina]
MIQKQGHWVPYELKPRDVERRFGTCELLLQRQKRKGFLCVRVPSLNTERVSAARVLSASFHAIDTPSDDLLPGIAHCYSAQSLHISTFLNTRQRSGRFFPQSPESSKQSTGDCPSEDARTPLELPQRSISTLEFPIARPNFDNCPRKKGEKGYRPPHLLPCGFLIGGRSSSLLTSAPAILRLREAPRYSHYASAKIKTTACSQEQGMPHVRQAGREAAYKSLVREYRSEQFDPRVFSDPWIYPSPYHPVPENHPDSPLAQRGPTSLPRIVKVEAVFRAIRIVKKP